MKRRRAWLAVAAATSVVADSAQAHHSFAAVYDVNRTISAAGVVTEFRFVNPHSMMTLEAVDADGNHATWTIEFSGRLNLTVSGWTEEKFKPGERITVYGNPTHTGSPQIFFRRIVREDGTEVVGTRAEGYNAIDEARRQRARERTEQN